MKNRIVLSLLLLFSISNAWAQNLATFDGRIFILGTQNGAAEQNYRLHLFNSSGTTELWSHEGLTDANGYFADSISVIGFPGNSYLAMVTTIDCDGRSSEIQRLITGPCLAFHGLDFAVCVRPPVCKSAFTAHNIGGTGYMSYHSFSEIDHGTAIAWNWDFGDGTTSTSPHPYRYTPSGNYFACLTVTSSNGCSATYCDTVRVTILGHDPWSVDLMYGQWSTDIWGAKAFTNEESKVAYYQFDFGDGHSVNTLLDAVPFSYYNPGSYQICATAVFSDSTIEMDCWNYTYPTPCEAYFLAMPDPSGQNSMLIVDNSWGNQITYLWDFGDGATSTSAYPQHTYAGSGLYYLCVSIADSNAQCTTTYCDSISVSNKVATPFTIQVVPFSQVTTAAEMPTEQVQQEISLYPNPAQSTLHVRTTLTQQSEVSLKVVDIQGRQVLDQKWGILPRGTHDLDMDVQDLPNGLYLAQIDQAGQRVSKKLLIAR